MESGKRNARSKAMLSQMAAAIALLQAAPIRLKNLTALDVNKNLIARGKRLYLVVAEIRSEEQRADRFRAASGNTGYPGLVRQRASTVFDQYAQ